MAWVKKNILSLKMLKMESRAFVLVFFILGLWFFCMLAACHSLKESKPIMPNKAYERLLLGDLNANYVGMDNCLKACHVHDELGTHFQASTMGARLTPESGMPIVDCESCHGPGSLAIEGLTPERIARDRQNGIQTACNYETLIDIKNLPAGAQSLICLKCHSNHALFNLHNWNTSIHAISEVSCSNCHPVHTGPDLTTKPRNVQGMCYECHPEKRSEFRLPSHHPVKDRMFCNDCHEPHGGTLGSQLRGHTLKELCARCHRDKSGPFLFEHADNNENCLNCHTPHGSVNNNLLRQREPFLCLQCHSGHRITTMNGTPAGQGTKTAFYTRCTDCHSAIHGTDLPSASGAGRFIR